VTQILLASTQSSCGCGSVVIVAVELPDPEFFTHRGEPVGRADAERGKFEVGNAGYCLGVDFAEPAKPDNSCAQTVHEIP
jgi:hypothetical protein